MAPLASHTRPKRPLGRRAVALAAILGAAAFAAGGKALAQSGAPTPGATEGAAQHRGETGPAEGAGPLKVAVTYTADALYDLRGGARPGAMYDGRLGFVLDADLERALGWRGVTAQLSVQAIHGTGLSGERVANLMLSSGLRALPTVRLYNLYLEKRLGRRGSLRVGQFTAGQEFVVSPTAALFLNSTFGWPESFAADLPSGGPADPIAAPGVRLELTPARRTRFHAAVFAGDPAGAGGGDPQARDRFGFNSFRLTGAPFVIAELQQQIGRADVKLGGWRHFDRFDDLAQDAQGRSLADPASRGVPLQRRGNSAVYLVADGRLWASADGGRVLHGFVRASWSPNDRNLVDRYADAGLTLSGLFAGRPHDAAGLAVGVSNVTPAAAALARDFARFTGQPQPIPTQELVLEATYQLQVHPKIAVQPDLQYVIRPNGGAPSARAPPLKDALVAGVRTAVKF